MAVIALIDGEHHPAAVRDALAGLDLAGVVFCGGEEKLGAGRVAGAGAGRGSGAGAAPAGPAGGGGGRPGRRAGAAAEREAAPGRAGPAPGPALRVARPAPVPAALRAGGLRRPEAGRDRDRQAHRQDGRRRSLGVAAARPGDRLHGPRRARRADRGRGRHLPGGPARGRRSAAATPRPTTSRTPCWRACAPSAAGAWAGGRPARRGSRTCPPGRRSRRASRASGR